MSRFGPPFPRFLQAGPLSFQQSDAPEFAIVIELEHFHDSSGSVVVGGLPHEWIAISDPLCGNNTYMHSAPDSNAIANPGDPSPWLRYRIHCLTSGDHYLWIRSGPPPEDATPISDSIHLHLDGNYALLCNNIIHPYDWTRFGPFTIPTLGPHEITLYMREDGTRLDRIALTANAFYQPYTSSPAEIGPPESPQA